MSQSKIIAMVCAGLLSLLSMTAMANAVVPGWYAMAYIGGAFAPNNFNVIGPDDLLRDEVEYNAGYDAGGELGYKYGYFRFSGEFNYINITPNHFDLDGVEQTNVDGKTDTEAAMANVYFDFDNVTLSFVPFVGIGAGYSHIHSDLDSYFPTCSQDNVAEDSFAYQATVGINWNFSENISTTFAYRYFATNQLDNFGKRFQANLANFGILYRFEEV